MKNKKILSILILTIIASLSYAVYDKFFITKLPEGQLSEKQIENLINKVSKLIVVPDEEPVVATIIKAEELMAEQKFYLGSQNGDQLIFFPKAQKALIYRKSENKLINVGPVMVDQPATTAPIQASANTQADTDTSTTTIRATSTKR